MLTKAFKLLILASFCLIGLGMVAPLSSNSINKDDHHSKKRLYVDPSQVSIDSCGIFIDSGDMLEPATAVYHDDKGFYIKQTTTISGTCGNGHASVSYISECADPICPYYYAEADW